MLREWDDLPEFMRTEEVRPYYEYLKKKKISLMLKRIFDVVVSAIMLIILSPVFLIISILIASDSKGGVFYRQERVTQYGRIFKIYKFRTMVANADKIGTQVTVANDKRVTKVGEKLRHYRLDELPQLINIILGDMTFVGTRPEVPKYVNQYVSVMMATLLLPAGVTSETSILYKNEDMLLHGAENVSKVYVEKVLPGKMYYNLKSIEKFSLLREIRTMFKTVLAVCGKNYSADVEGEKRFAEKIKDID